MAAVKGKFYITLVAVEDRSGKIVGFRAESVTLSPPKVPKGIPIELELEIDDSVFRPLKISAGTIVIATPPVPPPAVVPPPPAASPAPTSLYARALARAEAEAAKRR